MAFPGKIMVALRSYMFFTHFIVQQKKLSRTVQPFHSLQLNKLFAMYQKHLECNLAKTETCVVTPFLTQETQSNK